MKRVGKPSPQVEVVVINHRRPDNVRQIVEAFRQQSVPCSIALIDDPAEIDDFLDDATLESVDTIYRFSRNYGPFSRFVPLASYSHEFTYFHDDDMLPGSKLIEHLLETVANAPPFGVLGHLGRCLDADGVYRGVPAKRTGSFVPIDIAVRGFFLRTISLAAVVPQLFGLGLVPGPDLEDDLVLCTAQNMINGLTNYLIPRNDDPETAMCKIELPAPHARQERDVHKVDRTWFCKMAIEAGWKPLFMHSVESDAQGQ